MAASIDFNQNSVYLLNKYFIQPVLSLNTSVTNLDSSVTSFNNSSSVIANTSSIAILNASTLANTSSIINLNISFNSSITDINSSITQIRTTALTLNTSVSNLSIYVTNFNSSVNASIAVINSSIIDIRTTASTLNTSVSNLSNYVTNFNSSVNASIAVINSSIIDIRTTALTLNTSVSNLSNYVTNFNTSFNNAIDLVSSTTLTIGGTNGTSTQSYGGSLTSGTLNIAGAITTGNINIGNTTGSNIFIGNSSVANIFIGGFKFLAKTISGITTGILNLFTDFNGTNANLFTGMTSGTIAIGSSTNTNVIGNLNIIANSIHPKTSNIMSVGGTNTTTLNLGSESGTIVNVGNAGAATSLKGGFAQISLNESTPIASYLEVGSGAPNIYLDFHCGGSGSNVDYDGRIICSATNTTATAKSTMVIDCGKLSITPITTIGNSTPPTVYCCLGITTITPTLRDGIAIKAAQTNGMDFMQFLNQSGAIIGQITNQSGTGVGYVSNSDRRLKKDIIQMENILDKIMLLKPYNYNWISNDTPSFGFIAQEVFEIFPTLYNEMPNSDGNIDEPCDEDTGKPLYYGLDYGRFTPYIVKGLQEQNTIITNLQKENEDLKLRLSAIEARLAAAGI